MPCASWLQGRRAAPWVLLAAFWLALASVAAPRAAQAQELDPAVARSVVRVKSFVPRDARTAELLGTQREGNGVVIDGQGLVLTIGYLILEAMAAEVTDHAGTTVPARILGYDHETGLGLLRADKRLSLPPLALGSASGVSARDRVFVVGHPSQGGVQGALVVSRRVFAGSWEYLLEDAIFTVPAHAGFGGAALIDGQGRLIGIGSLLVRAAVGEEGQPALPGNMFVPIDLLPPILADLRDQGRARRPARPWLGVRLQEVLGRLFVEGVVPDSPAQAAGLGPGDIVIAVDGVPLAGTLADFYRKVWGLGEAGVSVPLTVLQGNVVRQMTVRSGNRYRHLKLKPSL